MKQHDWVGGEQPAAPLRDIRNTRPSVAEQKAERLLELGKLMNKVPDSVRSGSVQTTRQWMAARDRAASVAKSTRSSVPEIEAAINALRRFL